MTTNIVLVPGFWLGGWAWDEVGADLAARGNNVIALTLPGRESSDGDRSAVTLEDQARAILDAAPVGAVVVAHSGGGYAAYLASDLAPEAFSRIVYVDSGPVAEGFSQNAELDESATEVPLPSWAEFEARGASLEGLDPDMLQRFRDRAVPEPAHVVREGISLSNPKRYTVPTALICNSFPSEAIKQMRDAGSPMCVELRHFDAEYTDLPTGHWPMWSRPADLAEAIHRIANSLPTAER